MALINLDLIGSLAIDKGYQWEALLIFPGNASKMMLTGQIKDAPGGNLLSNFQIGQAVFDTHETRVLLYLSAALTSALTPTSTDYWVYGVTGTFPGKPAQLLLSGKVQVNPAL